MRRASVTVLAVLALGACGGGDGDVSADAQRALEPHVAEIRVAAAARNAEQLRIDLAELRDTVDVLVTEGELTEEGAANIRRQADAVEQQVGSITTTTVPRRSAPVTQVQEQPKEEKKNEERKDRENDESERSADTSTADTTAADTGGDPGAGGEGGGADD